MLYNKGNHAQLKRVQPQPSRLQGENGGKIYSTWNPGAFLFSNKITANTLDFGKGLANLPAILQASEAPCAPSKPLFYACISIRMCPASCAEICRSSLNAKHCIFKTMPGCSPFCTNWLACPQGRPGTQQAMIHAMH